MYSSLMLKNSAYQRCQKGYPWFSLRDLIGRKPALAGIVRLIDRQGRFGALACCSPDDSHPLRVITRDETPLDEAFWRGRFRRARERRRALTAITDAYRVVYAESDGIPAVIVDRYHDVVAFEVGSTALLPLKPLFITILHEELQPKAIVEKGEVNRLLFGQEATTVIREGDQEFEVDLLTGQKTGAYLDYRAFRLKARELARGRVFDGFCYQGWLACHVASKATEVVAVDASAAALSVAKKNAVRNRHRNITFLQADLFDAFPAHSGKYDFIHLDPPAVVKEHDKLASALHGYRKLLKQALPLLNARGTILLSACSHKITERLLEKVVREAFEAVKLRFDVVFRGVQDRDHPVLQGVPETLYLKAIAVMLK